MNKLESEKNEIYDALNAEQQQKQKILYKCHKESLSKSYYYDMEKLFGIKNIASRAVETFR